MCDKSYTQSHSLNYHVKIHHEGMKAEKRYKCDLCEKAFTQSHSLKDHQKKAHIVKQYGLDTIARWDWKKNNNNNTTCSFRHMRFMLDEMPQNWQYFT